jgi:MFS family permease
MDLSPLRHRDYRLLFVAQSISLVGTMVTYVALPYQMYVLTGSSLSVGLLGLAELVPLLTVAFVGGALADAVDRRRVSLLTDVGLGAGSIALAALAATHASSAALYVVAGWMAAVSALQRPSMEALVPRLVPPEEMPAVAALRMLLGSLAMIAGPALGGILIASAGLSTAYLVDAASYALSLACLWQIRQVPPVDDAEKPSVAAVVDGFQYARGRQELVGTYVVDFVAMVFGMPLALFPAMSGELGGARALGWLYAAPAVGALMASVTSRWTPRVTRHGLAVLGAATVWGLAIVGFGVSHSIVPALGCLVVAGSADALSGMFRMTMWNQTIPDVFRGRLASIEMVSYSSGPLLGHLEAGFVAALFGVRASVVSGGALCVVGVVMCGLLLPRFVTYDARAGIRGAQLSG